MVLEAKNYFPAFVICKSMISVTFENPCTFENGPELENVELQGLILCEVPPTPSEV